MSTVGKRHRANKTKVDADRRYTVEEAVQILRQFQSVKFDESVEISIKLGVDPKKADQLVRGTFSLPKGIGKTQRVIAVTEGERAEAAKAAGADVVGGADLIKRIEEGWLEFDVMVTTPDMMRQVGKLGRVLGPKGLMPSPKSGTVTEDLATAVREFKAGKIEYRTDAAGNINVAVGKRSFSDDDLIANIKALIERITESRPASVKGRFVEKICISSTMSPGIRLAVA